MFSWLRLRFLRRLFLGRAVTVHAPPDPRHQAEHRPDRGEPPPRQLHQTRQQHTEARRQRPVPRARGEHQPDDDGQPAEVPRPPAEQPVQPEQGDQHEHDEPGQPRDPEPPGERPQQQRGREDRHAGGALAGAGEAAPAVCGGLRWVGGGPERPVGRPHVVGPGDRVRRSHGGHAGIPGRGRRCGARVHRRPRVPAVPPSEPVQDRRVSARWKLRCARDGVGPRCPWYRDPTPWLP